MNPWGLPDWRDRQSYGGVARWTFNRWRWEFYRRRPDLRAYYDGHAAASHRYWSRYAGRPGFPLAHLRPDEPGFTAIVAAAARKRFGYSALPNPRIGEQPEGVIRPWVNDSTLRVAEDAVPALDPGEFAVLFDLDRPIEAQLDMAREVLRWHQEERHGKPLQRRRHPGKWLTYLRVLDAREAGASWAAIASILPSTAQKPQSARDTWELAAALRFNF